jgi:hypothetical protein
MSTKFRYNRDAQMTQQRSRFLDKKDGVCATAARHLPSARPTRRRLATRIVLASTHHTCGCIPRTHTQFRMSRPPSRARIRAAETFAGFSWLGACTGTQIVTVFTGKWTDVPKLGTSTPSVDFGRTESLLHKSKKLGTAQLPFRHCPRGTAQTLPSTTLEVYHNIACQLVT